MVILKEEDVTKCEGICEREYNKWKSALNPEGHEYYYTENKNRVDVVYVDVSQIDELKRRNNPWYCYLYGGYWYEQKKQRGMQNKRADKRRYVNIFDDDVILLWDVTKEIPEEFFEERPATSTTAGGTWGEETEMKMTTMLPFMDAEMYVKGRKVSREEMKKLEEEYQEPSKEWQKIMQEKKREEKERRRRLEEEAYEKVRITLSREIGSMIHA